MDTVLAYANSATIVFVAAFAVVIALWIKFVKTGPVYKHKSNLVGKTALITGGNAGIGKETAVQLAKTGARVIIACRNEEKAFAAMMEIRRRSGSDTVHCMIVDLADLDSVRRFADEFIETEPRLHILVNNAAIMSTGRTKDGLDLMFMTNHLGPFLLTNLLMPLLKKTSSFSPVRIINLSSDGYRFGKIDFENLSPVLDEDANFAQVFVQYCNTKLMNIYFTTELEKKLREDPRSHAISTYSLHPGTILTRLSYDYSEESGGWKMIVRKYLWHLVCRPPFYGCQTVLYCCLDEGIEDLSGKYFEALKMMKLLPHACDSKVGRKLWEVSEGLAGLGQ